VYPFQLEGLFLSDCIDPLVITVESFVISELFGKLKALVKTTNGFAIDYLGPREKLLKGVCEDLGHLIDRDRFIQTCNHN
jgi:hypothetical protein